jgi:hypothetical protein
LADLDPAIGIVLADQVSVSVEKLYLVGIAHKCGKPASLADVSANNLKPGTSLFEGVIAVWARARKDNVVERKRKRHAKAPILGWSARRLWLPWAMLRWS